MTTAAAWCGRTGRALAVAAVVAFMFAPTAVMTVVSFSGDSYLSFPPAHWGLRQYREALVGGRWLDPLQRSLEVGVAASAAAVLLGTLAAVAVHRSAVRGRRLLEVLAVSPLLVPALAYAIALYIVFSSLGLLGTSFGLVAAHAVLGVPFAFLVVGGAIGRVSRELEAAAMSLGAGRARAIRDVTMRIVAPALVAACILTFLTSFDEVVIASFVSGVGFTTLPKAIFDDVRTGVDPSVASVGVLLTLVNGALLVAVAALRRRAR